MKIQINRGLIRRPQKVVLYAPEGIGKSTIASQLPAPLFIDLEQGTHHLDVARVEPSTLFEVEEILVALATKKITDFRTLVIDTVDWLEEIVTKQICADGQKKSIEDFSYGKGYVHLAEKMSTVLDKLDRVAAAGVDVVLLAHSQVKKFEAPDDAKAYDRYELKLAKQVGPLVKEWCDALLFANWKTNLKVPDEGKAKGIGGKERRLYATHTAAWDAKNRHNLKDEEPFTVDTFKKILGAGSAPAVTPGMQDPGSDAGKPESGTTAEPPASPPPSQPEPPDHVPGLDSPIEAVAKLVDPHKEKAIKWLVLNKHITEGQGIEAIPASLVERILKRPTAFIDTISKVA